jgi:hypothetical protein
MIFHRTPFGTWWINPQTTTEIGLLEEEMQALQLRHPFCGQPTPQVPPIHKSEQDGASQQE